MLLYDVPHSLRFTISGRLQRKELWRRAHRKNLLEYLGPEVMDTRNTVILDSKPTSFLARVATEGDAAQYAVFPWTRRSPSCKIADYAVREGEERGRDLYWSASRIP